MKEFTDQMNQTIRLSGIPRRIVSLVPSQTELLYSLGLGDRVVGITKFCIHPNEWYKSKKRVGGTKNIDLEKVRALEPDLIIGNKEENEKSNIEALSTIAPIWMSDIFNLEDALTMIQQIGEMVDESEKANQIIGKVTSDFEGLSLIKNQKTVLYLIWKNPYLTAGKDTFIDDMLSRCGFINFIKESRYPELRIETQNSPDYIFLSSEPYPFKEKHIIELQEIYPNAIIRLVDGEMFSWYGSRLLEAADYFKSDILT